MPVLSLARAGVPTLEGLELIRRGKVRDMYRLPFGLLLIVATDGVSIFDLVLEALIPMKGIVLNTTGLFWTKKLADDLGIETHLVAAGSAIDAYLPEQHRNNPDLQSRSIVAHELVMFPVEFVARGFLTGSGLKSYQATRSVCGHNLPPRLWDGDELPFPIDTPTTKAQEGHDEAVDAEEIRKRFPEAVYQLLRIYQYARWVAAQQGLVLADTKLEMGTLPQTEELLIGDEIITPDSSRFWDGRAWKASQAPNERRKAPTALDKQIARAWGIEHGIDKLDPANPEHVERVQALDVPDGLIRALTQTYRYIFWRLVGEHPEMFLARQYGVVLPRPPLKRVVVLLGSESDKAALQIPDTLQAIYQDSLVAHVISCHRNPDELDGFVRHNCDGAQTVIAAGGKAFALPGVIKALIDAQGLDTPVVGVALGESGTESFEAARLSIKQLPGQPVVMNELTGEPYAGPAGFNEVLARIAFGELPPSQPQERKLAEFNIPLF
ncbi:MAG: AIR carboxylase family protein [Candidatus Kerfeldbacteria bacterium]|nr:AIR carboxylase family protein [Candidatus Kerfeldbacteria bacterium]